MQGQYPTPADSTDEQATASSTGPRSHNPPQSRVVNQLQASARQIVPRPQVLAAPADLYHSQVANQFQASAQPPILAPPPGLYHPQEANQFHAPDQLIPPGLQLPTQPQASNQLQVLYQPQASNQLQASYQAQASYRPHIPALLGLAQPQTQTANPGVDRGRIFAMTTVYIDDLLQDFNAVRELYGVSRLEKVDDKTFWDRIYLDPSKVTPSEAPAEPNDRESRCHIGFTATTDLSDRNADPNDKSRWVYLRYCMETTDDPQKNWRFEKHFRMPVERSMVTLLPGLDIFAAKSMALRHIDWWQKQAYMDFQTEQILCAARRRVLKVLTKTIWKPKTGWFYQSSNSLASTLCSVNIIPRKTVLYLNFSFGILSK